MRTFLVTGGAGFIGSHIATALVERGDEVRVLDNLSTGKLENLEHLRGDVEFIEGCVTDPDVVARAVEGVDCIFHEAAQVSVPLSIEQPLLTHAACATGTLVVLDAARRAGVRRLVYAGSSSAYGDRDTGRAAKFEDDLPAPVSPYGASKLAGEYYCQMFAATYGFDAVVLRYFNVFGPRQGADSPYSAVIPLFSTALIQGRQPTIFGDGTQSRDFTYVDNIVHGNLLAADAPNVAGKVINVAMGRSYTLLELLDQLQRLLGTRIEPNFAPPRAGDVQQSLADITRARELLGFEPPVSFEDGLDRSIAFYREDATAAARR